MALHYLSRGLLKQASAQVRCIGSSACLSSPSPSATSQKFQDYWPVEGSPVAPADAYYTWDVTKPVKLHMTDEYPGNLNPVTVPAMFKVSLEVFPGHVAMADRRGPGNEWKKWNYEQYYEETYAAARGFAALGLSRFGGLGILGRNSPEWFMSSLGCIAAGGLPVGLYNTSSPEIIAYIAGHAPFDIFCVEDQAELDRVLQGKSIEQVLPTVKKVIFMSPDAKNINSDKVITWKDLIMLGRSESDSHIRHIEKTQCANEACVLVYTSGTTGMPKGDLITFLPKIILKL